MLILSDLSIVLVFVLSVGVGCLMCLGVVLSFGMMFGMSIGVLLGSVVLIIMLCVW